jgi:hypothetical protein
MECPSRLLSLRFRVMDRGFPFVQVVDPTWLLYVAVLVIAVYFRFTRVFTIRNLDLILLLLIATASALISGYKDAIYFPPLAEETLEERSEALKSSVGSEEILSKDSQEIVGTSNPAPDDAAPHFLEPTTSNPSADANRGEDSSALAKTNSEAEAISKSENASASGEVVPTEVATLKEKAEPAEASVPQKHPVFVWSSAILLILSILLLIRLILDEGLTRRPRLEQNLNQSGLLFLCVPAFMILMAGALRGSPSETTFKAMEHARALLQRKEVTVDPDKTGEEQPAPTETLIAAGGAAVAQLSGSLPKSAAEDSPQAIRVENVIARVLVVAAHTTVIVGLMVIGKQHFASMQLGIAMSCLYLLLPCTAVNVHNLNHVLPAACLIWAIASYRKPIVSGILLGFAAGTLFFAVFLLPLWAVFYGRKGGLRFIVSVLGVFLVLVTALMMISNDASSLVNKLVTTANWTAYRLLDDAMPVDSSLSQLFVRIPTAAIFFVMLTAMTVLPRPRNLENLLANSTCLVVAAQLWYPDDIGAYVLWYLPLFLLVIFRPRLDRFTPPEIVGRQAEAVTAGTPASPPSSTVAMNRLSLFGK